MMLGFPDKSCHTKTLSHGMPGVHLRGVVIDIGIARLLRIQQARSRRQIGGGAAIRLETQPASVRSKWPKKKLGCPGKLVNG